MKQRMETRQCNCVLTTVGNWSLITMGDPGTQSRSLPQSYLACRIRAVLVGRNLFLRIPGPVFV